MKLNISETEKKMVKCAEKRIRKKKVLASLLALCLAVSGVFAFPLGCDTAEANEGEGDTWVKKADEQGHGYWYRELEEGGIEITGFTEPEQQEGEAAGTLAEVTVPPVLDGKNVVRIGNEAFYGGTSGYCRECVKKIVIPKGVTSIGRSAFEGCEKLEEIILPEGIVRMEQSAFAGCGSLKQLELPDSLISIEKDMVSGCGSLKEITIPNGVTDITPRALECGGLTAIYVSEENPSYASQDGILYNKDKSILLCCPGGKISGAFAIPENTQEIGDEAFWGCKGLTELTVTENVERIGAWAFNSLPLTQIEIPGTVKEIGEYAFFNCDKLGKITLGEGIETIGSEAFALTTTSCAEGETEGVTIPASVINLGSDVFVRCINLPAIYAAEGSNHYASEDGILYDKNKTTMLACPAGKSGEALIPASVTDIDIDLFEPCDKITAITVDDGNLVYASEDGILYNKDKTVLMLCTKAKIQPSEVRIIVPDTVQSIGEKAFGHGNGWEKHVTLVCYEGSPAQKYADEHEMKFEASREAYTFTITFDANGGMNTGAANLAVTEGQTISGMGFSLPAASRTGYDFLGWYTARTGGTKVTAETRFTGDQTVYAQWEQQSSEDDSNQDSTQPGGSGSSTQPGGSDGSTQPGGSDGSTQPGDSGGSTQPGGSGGSQQEQTVKYTVTFHKNGGSKISKSSITVEKGRKIGKLPTAQRKGYTLEGWYTAKKGGAKITSSTKITKNQTVYAHWKKVAKPKRAGKPSLKSQKSGQLTVSYKKISGVKGYEICWSSKKNFKGAKKTNTSKTKVILKKLKKETIYYVKVRGYKLDSAGKKVYGSYGAYRKLKIK